MVAVKGPTRPTTPSRLARFDGTWTSGEIFVRVDARYSGASRNPFEFPLEILFFPSVLGHNGGAVVHAAGAICDGHAFVFAGRSGAGKSTIARLLDAHGWEVVNDERVVIRVQRDEVLLYGTPWPGDLDKHSPSVAPVAGIFLLEHAPTTLAAPLTAAAAASALIPRCRLPFWDRRAMAGLLAAMDRIVARVPCYRLGFAPDASVLAFLERFDGVLARV
jgi:hypothetical protein